MAHPTYPAPTRPSTVTISSYLLWACAAITVLSGLVTLTNVGKMTDVITDMYKGTSAEGAEGFVVGASVGGVVVNVLFAAGYVILAIFNNRGRNGSRITTWVLGGLMLCCGGFGLAGTALTSSLSGSGGAGAPSQAEVQARLDAALPSWYQPLSLTLSVISLLAILATMILLALPPSNAFFRKPAAGGFDPSLPYPGYPGQQPPYPGQQQPQQPGQQPPYPGQQQPQQPGQQPPYPGQPQPPQNPGQDPWGQQKPPSDPTSQQ